jgi:hypothetical protein
MSDTEVELRRNDGSEIFVLKASRVETEVSNGLVTDSIVSGISREILGGKFVLDIRQWQIDLDIQGMDSSDYPNSGSYSDDDYGFYNELERASLEWGWDRQDGFDELYYDGRSLNGVFTNLNLVEDVSSRPARQYDASIEWTYLDVFIS